MSEIFEYSKKAFLAFVIFLVAFGLMIGLLSLLEKCGLFKLAEVDANQNAMTLLMSLPFIAFYLVVLLGATAGYARSQMMAEKLPLNKLLDAELKKRSMSGGSIKTKIRGGGQVKAGDSFLRGLTTIISSRIPILAVVDANNKVEGVVTYRDIARRLEDEIEKEAPETLIERLKAIKVADIQRQPPIVAETSDDFTKVIEKMIKNQFSRLIVVDSSDAGNMKFEGTLDMLDLIGEMIAQNGEN